MGAVAVAAGLRAAAADTVRHTSGTSRQLCVWTMVREPSLWLQSALDHQQRLFKMNSTDSLHRRQGHLMHMRPYQANWFVGAQTRGVRLAIYRTDALPHLVRDLAAALRIRCDGTRGCTAPSANVGGGQGIPIPSEVTEEYALDEALFRCIPPDGLVPAARGRHGERREVWRTAATATSSLRRALALDHEADSNYRQRDGVCRESLGGGKHRVPRQAASDGSSARSSGMSVIKSISHHHIAFKNRLILISRAVARKQHDDDIHKQEGKKGTQNRFGLKRVCVQKIGLSDPKSSCHQA